MTILTFAGDNVPAQPAPNGFKNYRTGATTIDTCGGILAADVLSTEPSFGFAGNRLFYPTTLLSSNLTTAGSGWNNEHTHNRIPVTSARSSGTTWAQIAAAVPGSSIRNSLLQRGAEIATWQNAHRGIGKWGATFMFTYGHENNGSSLEGGSVAVGGPQWLGAMRNIIEDWKTAGVTMWQGESNLATTVEGCIPGICLIAGNAAWTGHEADIDSFWPVNSGAANYTWANDNLRMIAYDIYNGSSLQRYWPIATLSDPSRTRLATRKAAQLARGYPLVETIYEQACAEISHFANGPGTGTGGWATVYPGLTYSKALWLQQAAQYYATSWPQLALLVYWDDTAVNGGVAVSPTNAIDSSPAAWDSFVTNWVNGSMFQNASDPLPGAGPPTSSTKVFVIN